MSIKDFIPSHKLLHLPKTNFWLCPGWFYQGCSQKFVLGGM